ncbi:MAG TPA: hypothetical protein ENN86_01885 [Desulfobacteraceae bacterium]|nr:hypothetical protein [Desulfobacteraceae bacterium]
MNKKEKVFRLQWIVKNYPGFHYCFQNLFLFLIGSISSKSYILVFYHGCSKDFDKEKRIYYFDCRTAL